jgi:hypothetical protein
MREHGVRPDLRLTADASVRAHESWGFNCGPGALCAAFGLTADEVRPHLGDFERRGYMSPTAMAAAIRSLGASHRQTYRGDRHLPLSDWPPPPTLAVVRIQFDGPWCATGVPMQARYGATHWIAVAGLPAGGAEVFDANNLVLGLDGWVAWRVWEDRVVARLAANKPRATGRWWPTHVWEVEAAAGAAGRAA